MVDSNDIQEGNTGSKLDDAILPNDCSKDIAIETNLSTFEGISQAVKKLADNYPEKFGVSAHEIGPDGILMFAKTTLTSGKKDYILGLSVASNKGEDEDGNKYDQVRQDILLQDSNEISLYRLEIRASSKLGEEYLKSLGDIERLRKQNPKVAETLSKISNTQYRKSSDGKILSYISNFEETTIPDKKALEILSNPTSLQFPPDMEEHHSLKDLRQQGFKFTLGS